MFKGSPQDYFRNTELKEAPTDGRAIPRIKTVTDSLSAYCQIRGIALPSVDIFMWRYVVHFKIAIGLQEDHRRLLHILIARESTCQQNTITKPRDPPAPPLLRGGDNAQPSKRQRAARVFDEYRPQVGFGDGHL